MRQHAMSEPTLIRAAIWFVLVGVGMMVFDSLGEFAGGWWKGLLVIVLGGVLLWFAAREFY